MMDSWFEKYIETIDHRLENLESKMDSMIRYKWQIMGGSFVISIILGVLIQILIASMSK